MNVPFQFYSFTSVILSISYCMPMLLKKILTADLVSSKPMIGVASFTSFCSLNFLRDCAHYVLG